MESSHPLAVEVGKQADTTNPSTSIALAHRHHIADALRTLVNHSTTHTDVTQNIHGSILSMSGVPWLETLVPEIESLTTKLHVGNFVAVRGTDQRIFESMPIYARCYLMFFFCVQMV